jgi:hypothetical protein
VAFLPRGSGGGQPAVIFILYPVVIVLRGGRLAGQLEFTPQGAQARRSAAAAAVILLLLCFSIWRRVRVRLPAAAAAAKAAKAAALLYCVHPFRCHAVPLEQAAFCPVYKTILFRWVRSVITQICIIYNILYILFLLSEK